MSAMLLVGVRKTVGAHGGERSEAVGGAGSHTEANLPCPQSDDLRPGAQYQIGGHEPAPATGTHGTDGRTNSRDPAQFATGSNHSAASQSTPRRGRVDPAIAVGAAAPAFEYDDNVNSMAVDSCWAGAAV